MNIPATNYIHFYEAFWDIGRIEPYAILSSEELASILKYFNFWARMIATHSEVAEIFGESSTAHIKLATDLRVAIKNSLREGTFPNVVLPNRKFTAIMTLKRLSHVLETEMHEILGEENEGK